MSFRTVLPLPKKYISLSAPQGRVYTQFLWYSVSHSPHTYKKQKTFLQTCINLQSYNARFFLHFYVLCQTKYWLCYNALREYVTKIIHSTRSVQNIPNLSNKACVFTCIQDAHVGMIWCVTLVHKTFTSSCDICG